MTKQTTITKENGYTVCAEMEELKSLFIDAVNELFDNVKMIKFFNYGEGCIMTVVILESNDYANYNIYKSGIHFCSYECSSENWNKFVKLAYNDDVWNGPYHNIKSIINK